MMLLVRTLTTRRRMPSRMTTWSQRNRKSGNFATFIRISDIHNPESWAELCATLEPNATSSNGL
eukprot:12397975-Karenia_brevis.AAC.1